MNKDLQEIVSWTAASGSTGVASYLLNTFLKDDSLLPVLLGSLAVITGFTAVLKYYQYRKAKKESRLYDFNSRTGESIYK